MWEHLHMNPEDDPEARIRDLERPLSDAARTSELGTQPYPTSHGPVPPSWPMPPDATYQYPSLPYPGSYPPVPARPRRGPGIGSVLFVVAGFALVAGIVAYLVMSNSAPTRDNPGFSGGGGVIASSPFKKPTGTKNPGSSPPQFTPATPSSAVIAPGAPISVSGVGSQRTITCNDSPVSVSGVSNTVKLRGHCTRLDVSGVQNVITVDDVDDIDVSGFNNRVTYHSGSPQIDNSGSSNTVSQG